MNFKVLGTGCSNCKKLELLTKDLVSELNIDATVEKVEDIEEIMRTGVMSTPALLVDGKLIVSGYVPSRNELTNLLKNI
ncbi:MAG: thioredoxin family protein [Candidatus Marinimicrobia bacterium]|nr:thioredoxin family protein [Candidatus Neomarinimicrobiota bacterium]